MRSASLVLGAALLPFLLAGCAEAASPRTTETPTPPPPFPRVAGSATAVSRPAAGDWRLEVRVPDAAAAYRSARSLLLSGGYQLTDDEPARDGGVGQACTTELCVSFRAAPAAGGGTLEYEVFHSTGMSG